MKLMFFSALAAIATADMEQIMKNLQEVINNSTRPVNPPNPALRSFGSSWVSGFIESINQYGCWCYFQDDHGKGRGPAANEVDALCQKLHQGYECIILDALEEGDTECVPWNEPYQSGSGLGLVATDPENNNNANALRKSCARANRFNDCARRTCIVENFFIMQMFKTFLSSVTFDPSLKHSLGNWDRIDDCPTKAGIDAEKECCGTYPHRFPFKLQTLYGARNCCGELTYNPDVMECCSGNVVKLQC
jgi:hypothetical protein